MLNHSEYLKAMGIDVWKERNPSTPKVVKLETVEKVSKKSSTKTDIATLNWQSLPKVIEECQYCDLSRSRRQTVFGSGNQTASLMIIGDMPSEQDEKDGDVFSGQAGKLLTAMLKAMGYQRSDVYISNIVKCRTPENQEPDVEQTTSCEPYLLREIGLLQPKLILALGSIAAQRLLKSKSTMGRLRGQLHYADGIQAPILISYHPTYLLAAPNEKRKAWEDLQIAMKELKLTEASC